MSLNWSDVFPALSDEVPDEDFNGVGIRAMSCKICGAMVVYSGRIRHIEFHERLGQYFDGSEWRPC